MLETERYKVSLMDTSLPSTGEGPNWSLVAPLPREGSAEMLATRIRHAITSGVFPPDYRLGEVELADRFGISRGAVREALHRLAAEGLVRKQRNRGAFVMGVDLASIRDLYLARRSLEETAAVWLTEHAVSEAIDDLQQRVNRISRAVEQDLWEEIVEADMAFHEALIATAGSLHLVRLFSTLTSEVRTYLHWTETTYPDRNELTREHSDILMAIRSGEVSQVRQVVASHMLQAATRISRITSR